MIRMLGPRMLDRDDQAAGSGLRNDLRELLVQKPEKRPAAGALVIARRRQPRQEDQALQDLRVLHLNLGGGFLQKLLDGAEQRFGNGSLRSTLVNQAAGQRLARADQTVDGFAKIAILYRGQFQRAFQHGGGDHADEGVVVIEKIVVELVLRIGNLLQRYAGIAFPLVAMSFLQVRAVQRTGNAVLAFRSAAQRADLAVDAGAMALGFAFLADGARHEKPSYLTTKKQPPINADERR